MKTLTSTLLAAQRSSSAQPYVQAVFTDYDGDARRARFTEHYDGSEDVWFHAGFHEKAMTCQGQRGGRA
jgi:hypothetical protein